MRNLVILHGWGQSRVSWRVLIEKFSIDFEVFNLDFPGFGSEPLISPGWSIPEYAEWTATKLKELELHEPIIIGHSFGGRIAAYMVAKDLYQPFSLIFYGAPLLYRPSVDVRRKIKINKILKKVVPGSIRSRFVNNSELNDADRAGLGKIFRNVVNFDQTDLLPNINQKCLLLWGEHDADVPIRIAKEINSLIKDSSLEIMPGLGHNAHLENPNLFYGKIKKFIEQIN